MREGVEARLDPQRTVEEVVVHSQGVVGEVEALHLGEGVEAEVACKHGQAEEEVVAEDSHQEEGGVAGVEEAVLHLPEEVVEVALPVQLDPPQSANTRCD